MPTWIKREVRFREHQYPYYFGADCVDRIAWELGRYDTDQFLVVTDDTVLTLHGESFISELRRYGPVEVLSEPPGEGMKSLLHVCEHLERAVATGASKRSVVLAFGGGVPGNLAGMVASLLFRGVRLIHVPTTTVAAMDSVISLKQAVNSTRAKNHFGSYHAPEAVYVDVRFLETLPLRELRSGLCEALKNCLAIRPQSLPALRALLRGGDLSSYSSFFWLLEESLAAKSLVTEQDPTERRAGLILEYGHTIGHAVEFCDHERRGPAALSHGEAVAFGMLAAARVSGALGELDDEGISLHDELVAALGVPSRVPPGLSLSGIMARVRYDNKRGYAHAGPENIAMVLLREIGEPIGSRDFPITTVPVNLIKNAVVDLGVNCDRPDLQVIVDEATGA